MRKTGGQTSLLRLIRQFTTSTTVLLTLPVLIGLVTVVVYSSQTSAILRRMNTAAELKPVVETSLAEDLFSVAAGRVSYEMSGVETRLERTDAALDTLLAETDGEA